MTRPPRAVRAPQFACLLAGLVCLSLANCGWGGRADPAIEFTKVPPAGEGSTEKFDDIEGRVTGARPGDRIVLYARSGPWWLQPLLEKPFTPVLEDSTWKNTTHPGTAYAALLVTPAFRPPPTLDALPEKGGAVVAVASVELPRLARPPSRTMQFSGYEWKVRESGSDPGGTRNYYHPSNAWTDEKGYLHLRIAGGTSGWTGAEVSLTRSLGYGSYSFVVQDVSRLEPAAVFSMLTWDDAGPPREMDVEISRWGEPDSKNAQFVVQPYHVPANSVRFMTPAGTVTYVLNWAAGRASFQAIRGNNSKAVPDVIAEHVFTSGIPSPGSESIHMNLYVYGNRSNPLRRGVEVVIEKFEYLP